MFNKYAEVALALGLAAYTLPSRNDGELRARDAPLSGDISQSATSVIDLTNQEFEQLNTYLPPEPRANGSAENRAVLNALLWSRQRGRSLTQLPTAYGISPEAARKRSERWAIACVWDRMLAAMDAFSLSFERREQLRALCVDQARRGTRIRNRRAKAS